MESYIELKDVFAIEKKLKQLDYPTLNDLQKSLKSKFTKKELKSVLAYFLDENMILMDKGHMVWIHNPRLNNLLHKRGYVVL